MSAIIESIKGYFPKKVEDFISKIADEHVRTTHNLKNKYICTNCDKEI